VSTVPRLDGVAGLTLPIEAYYPLNSTMSLMANAQHQVATNCMKRFGYTWTALPDHARPQASHLRREYGIVDAAVAAKYGYNLPEIVDEAASPSPLPPPYQLSDAETLVLTGLRPDGSAGPKTFRRQPIPKGGCLWEGLHSLTTDESGTDTADEILFAAYGRSQADPRVIAIFKKWSACMAQSGYKYSDPMTANADPRRMTSETTASRAEIQTALADVACKKSTNLIGTWFAIESAYEQEYIAKLLPDLNATLARYKAAAVKAAAILQVPVPTR